MSNDILPIINRGMHILQFTSYFHFRFFRRKLLTTAQYIYKTLFQEEKGSDITVLMLGKAWRLHKVYISQVKSIPYPLAFVSYIEPIRYLCISLQSPYFASMFSGSWREANERVISVEIADPNITLDCK